MATVGLSSVTRTFGRRVAVDRLDLMLEPGRIVGLLGPNGAGKSTTTRLILGLLLPDAGRVELFGRPPDDAGRNRVGYVPEQRSMPERDRPLDLLMLFGLLQGRSGTEARNNAMTWLERMGLVDHARDSVMHLSNGQQQKLQIALALMGEPDLLVLDEPLTALDPVHQASVLAMFRAAADRGATVLIATHRLWEAETFVDHVVLMDEGVKRLDGALQDVLAAHGGHRYRVRADGYDWVAGPGVDDQRRDVDGSVLVRLSEDRAMAALLARAVASGAQVREVAPVRSRLQDVYLDVVAS